MNENINSKLHVYRYRLYKDTYNQHFISALVCVISPTVCTLKQLTLTLNSGRLIIWTCLKVLADVRI